MQNEIQIIRTATGYCAKYIGPHATQIKKIMGTDTIPTPFTAKAPIDMVIVEVAKRNPGVLISQ